MTLLILLAVYGFGNIVYGFNCSSKYPNSYFITEHTLDAHFSTAVISSKESRSLIECSQDCEPANGCAGVVFHGGHCHILNDGTALKAASVSFEDGLPKMVLYEASISGTGPATVCDNTRCNYYCDCALCNTHQPVYVDCKYLKEELGFTTSGVYTINPSDQAGGEFEAYCDMTMAGGGWTVFQRRVDASIDFYRGWADYVAGFGDLEGNLWAGLDHLHAMTPSADLYGAELYIYMDTFEGESAYSQYNSFSVGPASGNYILTLSGYSGTAGDCLTSHSGMAFSTYDADRDISGENCAATFKGGWWYQACHCSNLNGQYLAGSHTSYADGVNHSPYKGQHYSLRTVIMMVRRI